MLNYVQTQALLQQ